MHHLAVGFIEALSRDIALQVIAAVDDWQPVGLGAFEGTHDMCHRCRITQYRSGGQP